MSGRAVSVGRSPIRFFDLILNNALALRASHNSKIRERWNYKHAFIFVGKRVKKLNVTRFSTRWFEHNFFGISLRGSEIVPIECKNYSFRFCDLGFKMVIIAINSPRVE